MPDIKLIQNILWGEGLILLAFTLWLFHRRQLHAQFPWFFRYLIFVMAKTPLLFVIYKVDPRATYFYAYYACETISIVIAFFVMHEVYQNILTSGSLAISRSTFISICTGLMLLSVLHTYFMEVVDADIHWRSVFLLSTVVRWMQVGLLLVLLMLTGFFGFYWQSQTFGIALGFGVYAIAELVTSSVRGYVGDSIQLGINLIKVLSYQLAVLIWLAYIYKSKAQPGLVDLPMTSMAEFIKPMEKLAK